MPWGVNKDFYKEFGFGWFFEVFSQRVSVRKTVDRMKEISGKLPSLTFPSPVTTQREKFLRRKLSVRGVCVTKLGF